MRNLSYGQSSPSPRPDTRAAMVHRQDIDGLRAVAIIPVVLFHSSAGLLAGGFIGVDIFFVISGFLITGIIAREIEAGTFSIWRFYERRARRLFPALSVVLLACILAASWILLPREMWSFGRALKSTALFGANIHFSKSDYFASASENAPLLHMWSLGVEEQFYIVLPLLLILAARLKLRTSLWISGLAIMSLAGSQWALSQAPLQAFYLLHFRAWELLLGAALALGIAPSPRSRIAREVAVIAGLALIAGSLFLLTPRTPFPGLAAAPACLGAALVLYSGMGGQPQARSDETFGARILQWKPLVFAGLISYPLYLWHWPIFVFAKIHLMRELTGAEAALLIGLAIILSVLTWRYIETPMRTRRVFGGRSAVFVFTGAAAAAAFAFGHLAIYLRGIPARWPASIAMLDAGSWDYNSRRFACTGAARDRIRQNPVCIVGDPEAAHLSFAVLGDSHAAAIWPAIEAAAKDAKQKGFVLARNSCAPLLGIEVVSKAGGPLFSCDDFFASALGILPEHPEITTVFLIGRWPKSLESDTTVKYRDAGAAPYSGDENPVVYARALDRLLTRLHGKRVVIVLPVPQHAVDIPPALARAAHAHLRPPEMAVSAFQDQKRSVERIILDLANKHQIEVADPSLAFCDRARCVTQKDGRALYHDDNHPSLYGAMLMKPLFAKAFENPANNAKTHGNTAD